MQCSNDAETNLATVSQHISTLAQKGAQLIVLPELHNQHYFCQEEISDFFDYAESIPGPSSEKFSQLAREHELVIVASLFEHRAAGLYHNTAVVFDNDGSIAGKYRKMHIPDDPGYYEKFYFTPGDLGFKPIDTSIGKLGVLICWDQWFPEAARLMTLAGADILIYPTAIGYDANDTPQEQQRQLDAWITVQRGHAVANGIPIVACNRSGFEPHPININTGIQFWGHSFICGPQGEFLVKTEEAPAPLTIQEIDFQHTEKVRRIWPFLRDRRIDDYEGLLQRYLGKP